MKWVTENLTTENDRSIFAAIDVWSDKRGEEPVWYGSIRELEMLNQVYISAT